MAILYGARYVVDPSTRLNSLPYKSGVLVNILAGLTRTEFYQSNAIIALPYFLGSVGLSWQGEREA